MSIKFPSITAITAKAVGTLKRFPLVMIAAAIGSYAAISMNHYSWNGSDSEQKEIWIKLIMTSMLAVPGLFAAACASERKVKGMVWSYVIQFFMIAWFCVYCYTLPKHLSDANPEYLYTFFCLQLIMHLLVAYAPFAKYKEPNGFWQFNRMLFLRFLLAVLYSGVLYVGLSIAILAVDKLFGVDVKDKVYLDLFFLMAGVFNTWIFLSGTPENIAELEQDENYPKGLRIFTQFVLLPIVGVYLLILYVYMAKIMLHWSLPVGWVSYLVIAFSITGILSFLLVYPWQFISEHKWIRIFTRAYYFLLLPLAVLLFVAIGRRIQDYGFTEKRYIVLMLGIWLSVVIIYFITGKNRSIKFIPASMLLATSITCMGPINMFKVSSRSQLTLLKADLTKAKMFENGKVKRIHPIVSEELTNRIESRLSYICEEHDYHMLAPLFSTPIDSIIHAEDSDGRMMRYSYNMPYEIMRYLNLSSITVATQAEPATITQYNYSLSTNEVLKVQGFDYYLSKEIFGNSGGYIFRVEGKILRMGLETEKSAIVVGMPNGTVEVFPLEPLCKKLKSKDSSNTADFSQEDMTLLPAKPDSRVKIVLQSLRVNEDDKSHKLSILNAEVILLFSMPEVK
jgi:Domain of unknown function (DUF4153)